MEWVSNYEETRWFLVLRVAKPNGDELNKLLHICNATVRKFGQLPLYTNPKPTVNTVHIGKHFVQNGSKACRISDHKSPIDWAELQDFSNSFHVSVAWTLEAPTCDVLEFTKTITNGNTKDINKLYAKFENLKIKMGNTLISIPLPITMLESKGSYQS